MKIMKTILVIMLLLMVSANVFATTVWQEEVEVVQTPTRTGNNFENLPIDISYMDLGVHSGDILFSENSATLIALDNKNALYLDFNVPYDDYFYYEIVDEADNFMLKIIDSSYTNVEKQFIIWKYLGVEETALRIAWLRFYHEDMEDYEKLSESKLFQEAADKQIGINIEEAIRRVSITADYKANGYSSITIEMRSYKDVAVNIPLGQKFENDQKNNQNLGVAEPVTVYIPKRFNKRFLISSYCINAGRGVPTGDDRLEIDGSVAGNVLKAITTNYAAGRASAPAAQSQVWEETDYDGAEYDLQEMGLTQEEVEWISGEPSQDNDETGSFKQFINKILNLLRNW